MSIKKADKTDEKPNLVSVDTGTKDQGAKKPKRGRSMLSDPRNPSWGIGTGNWCPDCGGLCGNSKHVRRW